MVVLQRRVVCGGKAGGKTRAQRCRVLTSLSLLSLFHAEKLLPHPQLSVASGLMNLNPPPTSASE